MHVVTMKKLKKKHTQLIISNDSNFKKPPYT